MNPYGYYQVPQAPVEYNPYGQINQYPQALPYSQPEYYDYDYDYEPDRQPQQIERRLNQLERQNERQEREINQLQRRLQRVNQRLRVLERRFNIPFTPFDGEF
ncbi:hypothetical protein ACIFOT_10600 [Neobacillus sp. NRS-1170]|uniref:hypothetical protein n=1 Tax=Neobacillus sp. NRS-1170 TaxID=3233898 RepID=UPI003D270D53